MPKMKTHKAGAKRYKVTANGKILRRQAGRKHLLGHKASARKNRLGGMVEVFDGNIEKIKLELPYIKYSR
jgi:large subunit ribosomal protein L35